jgi:hypothetical protein
MHAAIEDMPVNLVNQQSFSWLSVKIYKSVHFLIPIYIPFLSLKRSSYVRDSLTAVKFHEIN